VVGRDNVVVRPTDATAPCSGRSSTSKRCRGFSKQLDEVRRQIAAETARETAANDRLTSTVRVPVVRSVQAECRSIMLHNAVVRGALPRGAPFHFAAAAEATLFALVVHSIREDAAQADRKFDAWLMSPVGLP
jgi:hypothetical protein